MFYDENCFIENDIYCWDSVQLMCFVYVKDVDIPPRYVGKVGRQSQGSSGPIMTGIESSSVLMGADIVDMPYNVTNVISAPNFKCLAAAAAFISGYQGPVKVGQNALNIKIDGGLSLTNAAFEMHEKFQSLVAEKTNQASDGKSTQSTETEGISQAAMGTASYSALLRDICDVICAPSIACFIAADNFIKELQKCLKDEIIDLKIKIDGGLSRTVEGFYLHKQFRSLVAERGYNVDETYESSVQCPENNKIDPYINLAWRLNMALLSFQNKYSSAKWKMVIAFVDKSLESVLKDIHFTPLAPIEPRIYLVGDSSMDAEKKEE
ncbi:hypothetical protein T09_14432 [Trichinella sp. T9]|nr:hypothetical protein T09_14432 [Trichinella sp. T9]